MFRNVPVIKVALVPTTPTLESAHLCDTLATTMHKEDQRLHAIALVLLLLSDKDLPAATLPCGFLLQAHFPFPLC